MNIRSGFSARLKRRGALLTGMAVVAAALSSQMLPDAAHAATGQARGRPSAGEAAHSGARPLVHRNQGMPSNIRVDQPKVNVNLSIGRGEMITFPVPVKDIFIANDDAVDVQVRSERQVFLYGKGAGETTMFAVTGDGRVIYAANIHAGQNISNVDEMFAVAMPDAHIRSTSLNGMMLLTGTVASAQDAEEAGRLAQALVGNDVKVINRLQSAMPMQVNLQVKISEVSRELMKSIGVNVRTRDTTGGFQFGYSQGRDFITFDTRSTANLPNLDASSLFGLPAGSLSLPFDPTTGRFITKPGVLADFAKLGLGGGISSIGFIAKMFGIDVASAIDMAERDGLLTMLAQPTLTAASGETATFLAGGEIPIPIAQDLGTISIEYKPYGIALAFTPIVQSNGRIWLRVKPEVSELSEQGSIRLNSMTIPGLVTRRTETTIELGSGESFMISGMMRNNVQNNYDKTPGLADLPVLGAMFRANSYRRSQTELMVVVTPYLVKPTDAANIKLPTDAYQAPTDAERVLGGSMFEGQNGGTRPQPTYAPPVDVGSPPPEGGRAARRAKPAAGGRASTSPAVSPGFSR